MKTLEIEITFTEDILGTAPNDEDIYRNFIGSKAPDAQSVDEEVAALGADAVAERGMTVFARDENGNPALYDYMIKGHFKDACSMLRKVSGTLSSKLTAHKKEIDGLIFVYPRLITLELPEGKEMGACQRPLRTQNAKGECVALAMSESCPAGTKCKLEINCLVDKDIDIVREWLNYGALRGIGQWRNSGKGKYTWEEIKVY